MKRIFSFSLIFLFFLTSLSFAQPLQEDFLKQREEFLNRIKKESAKLYEFERRLWEIQKEAQKIMQDYEKGSITKEQARGKLAPLVKEEIQIRNNPDYLIEQRLNMFLAVLPSVAASSPQAGAPGGSR